jgi:hypothetical protein
MSGPKLKKKAKPNKPSKKSTPIFRHCDEWADDETSPEPLRNFLNWARLPGHGLNEPKPHPELYADYEGKTIRVVMASRFGDVGISYHLDQELGYVTRVPVEMLTNFRDKPA